MKSSDRNKNLLCKIQYFAGGTGLLTERKRWGCTIDLKMVAVQGSVYVLIPLNLMESNLILSPSTLRFAKCLIS
jgi:hypothetical protein